MSGSSAMGPPAIASKGPERRSFTEGMEILTNKTKVKSKRKRNRLKEEIRQACLEKENIYTHKKYPDKGAYKPRIILQKKGLSVCPDASMKYSWVSNFGYAKHNPVNDLGSERRLKTLNRPGNVLKIKKARIKKKIPKKQGPL